MKVILLKSVPKLGKTDDVVDVGDGYARNALFPRKLAIPATPEALSALKRKKDSAVSQKAMRKELLDQAIAALANKHLVYKATANEQGHLFAKIDAKDIAAFFDDHRFSIDPKCIELPNGPIKEVGEHMVLVKDGEYKATVLLTVEKK